MKDYGRGPKTLNKINESIGERIFSITTNILMFILIIIFVLPFWAIIASSFVNEAESAQRGSFILWPSTFNFSAYNVLLSPNSMIYNAYSNTIFLVVVGTAISLLMTSTMAYGLSKKMMPGRNAITAFVFFTMLFGGGLIPSFLLNRSLGLTNNVWALILPYMISPWNMFIMRNFFMEIPESLEEAASIDGASPPKVLFSIILPISMPVMATIGLFYAVGYWNSWFPAMIYINDIHKMPIQNIMRNMIVASSASDVTGSLTNESNKNLVAETVKSATIVISTLPIMCVYPFIQKHFVKGVMVGAIKG